MRAVLHETRTGLWVADLERTDWSYGSGILVPDKGSLTVPTYTRRASTMDLQKLLTPYKYSVALIDESVEGVRVVRASGPITARPPKDDTDGRTSLDVSFRGPEILWQLWHIRKYPGWPLLGPDGKPTGTYDLGFDDLSLGTIIKRWVQEWEKWEGNDLPLIFEPDRAGTRERLAYEAVDGKPLLEAMDDIGERADGIEWAMVPEIDDLDRISYRLVTGTDTGQVVVGNDALTWNLGGERPDIRGWEPNDRIGDIATDAIFSGGKGDDEAMLVRATDPTLVADGWPRMEVWDSSNSTVVHESTLQGKADARVSPTVSRPSFEVRAERAHGVRYGDVVEVASQGHWYVPDGETRYRLMSVSQQASNPDWIGVSLV